MKKLIVLALLGWGAVTLLRRARQAHEEDMAAEKEAAHQAAIAPGIPYGTPAPAPEQAGRRQIAPVPIPDVPSGAPGSAPPNPQSAGGAQPQNSAYEQMQRATACRDARSNLRTLERAAASGAQVTSINSRTGAWTKVSAEQQAATKAEMERSIAANCS